MGRISAPENAFLKQESESEDAPWSEEHERVPLKQRIKLLMASNRVPKSEMGISVISESPANVSNRSYKNQCYSQEENSGCFKVLQNGETNEGVSHAKGDACQIPVEDSMLGKVNATNNTSLQHMFSSLPIEAKDSNASTLKSSNTDFPSGSHMETVKIENELPNDFSDNLDFVVLKERKRMLLSRNSPSPERKIVEGTLPTLSSLVGGQSETSGFSKLSGSCLKENSSTLVASESIQGKDLLCSANKTLLKQDSLHESNPPSDNSKPSLSLPIVKIKVEPIESVEVDTTEKHSAQIPSCNFSLPIKKEVPSDSTMHKHDTGDQQYIFSLPIKREVPCDSITDELDHIPLRERLKLSSQNVPTPSEGNETQAYLSNPVPSMTDSTPIAPATAEPVKVYLSRKRRKTVTDSVELALEEDAPGLLKVLLEKGVSADEIKLYGEPESDESLDDLSTEDSFSELEEIVSKLFTQRHSMLKIHSMHFSKGEKACYCLACLFSLVEQARYLKLRKWPVEWGWCRDLQSFIFVFERHNRIVLERPEYGYATYFFELVESIPINWQIKRLITAMKLTSCSRVSLLENRALLVGEDVTEGEARVLVSYGWTPNTGLGSMLNYCDRVVHDRRQQVKDSSEWRSKIGKMLVNGFNGGKVVPVELPSALAQDDGVGDDTKVKLELD